MAFARFLVFLQDVGEFLAAHWPPDVLALQLMTEPVTDSIPWNELQPQMWQVARRTMPGHTLILAGDQVGKIEGLITTEPVDDENVLYSFTFYDPFLFTLQGAAWLTPPWWSHLGPVPYPSSPEVIDRTTSELAQQDRTRTRPVADHRDSASEGLRRRTLERADPRRSHRDADAMEPSPRRPTQDLVR